MTTARPLQGQVAVVSGGASGLGAAAAEALTGAGAEVAVLDRNPRPAGSNVAFTAQVDVVDSVAVSAAVARVGAELGPVRIVVTAAGIVRTGRLLAAHRSRLTLDDVRTMLEVNVLGTFNLLTAAADVMAENTVDDDGQRGTIVTVGSIAERDGQAGAVGYAASKGAVRALSLAAARDLAPQRIRCVSIAPGTFDTPMLAALAKRARDRLEAASISPARFGRPSEFGALVLHVVANPFLNGTTIEIDGASRLPIGD